MDDPAAPIAETSGVADCKPDSVVMAGQGPDNWRKLTVHAGPLGVFRRSLLQMSDGGDGILETKMPVLVEGHRNVTLSVPPDQRRRISLYYGREAMSFNDDDGFDSIVFRPCANKDVTPWPGGIQLRGLGPVRLKVEVDGSNVVRTLGLGRPHILGSD